MSHWITSFSCRGLIADADRQPKPRAVYRILSVATWLRQGRIQGFEYPVDPSMNRANTFLGYAFFGKLDRGNNKNVTSGRLVAEEAIQ